MDEGSKKSQVELTRWGLGTAPLAGLYRPIAEADAVQAVLGAYQRGVRYFDTAPLYGEGLAEQRLGLSLAELGADDVVISTKVGYTLRPGGGVDHDYRPEAIERSFEQSLKRLRRDFIDLVYIHDPDDHYQAALDQTYPLLHRWRESGVIRAIGVGMNQSALLTRFAQNGDFDCFLLAGRYTLLDQSAVADLLPAAQARGIRLIIGGVFNSGILTDPWAERPMFNYAPAPDAWVARARALDQLCRTYQVPLKAAALQFPAAHPAVASVLTGVESVAEVEENAALWKVPIPTAFWEALRQAHLVVDEAALPAGV